MLAYWRVIVTHGITVECHSSDLEMIEEISSNYNPIETSKSIVWEHDIFPGFKQTLVGWLVGWLMITTILWGYYGIIQDLKRNTC